jgi:hypothetical protein
MLTISKIDLTKDVHFPVMRALPSDPVSGIFAHIRSFLMYRRKFQLIDPYILWCPFFEEFIYHPDNFIYDGASVPKILNGLYGPTGMLLYGAVSHDFGYRYNGLLTLNPDTFELTFKHCSKGDLDSMFGAMCKHESSLAIASYVAEKSLTVGGFVGWNENRKKDLNLIEDFPFLKGLYASVVCLYDRRKGRRSTDGGNIKIVNQR